MMRRYIWRALLATVAVLLMAPTAPAFASVSGLYEWGSMPPSITDLPDLKLKPGEDIVAAWYASDAGKQYFRIELAGAPDTSGNKFAPIYGIFIDSSGTDIFKKYSNLLDLPIDTYIDAEAGKQVIVNPENKVTVLGFTPSGQTLISGQLVSIGGIEFAHEGTFLEWSLPKGEIATSFSWLAATLTGDALAPKKVLDKTSSTTATPIPGAAWLFGSGILGLVGLKRRSRKS